MKIRDAAVEIILSKTKCSSRGSDLWGGEREREGGG